MGWKTGHQAEAFHRRALRLPIRAAKNWGTNKKAANLCGDAALGRLMLRASKPDHAFF